MERTKGIEFSAGEKKTKDSPQVWKIMEDYCLFVYEDGAPTRVGPESFDRGGADVQGIQWAEVNWQTVREALRVTPASNRIAGFIKTKWHSKQPRFEGIAFPEWLVFEKNLLDIAEMKYRAIRMELY